MKQYIFKLWFTHKQNLHFVEYQKTCKYPKKTKMYKNLMYLLDNDNRTVRLDINQKQLT